MLKVWIGGSREIAWLSPRDLAGLVQGFLRTVCRRDVELDEVMILHGAARGVDWAAHRLGQGCGGVEALPARWEEHGKIAGILRNEELAERADVGIFVWNGTSRGTQDSWKKMLDRGKPALLVFLPGPGAVIGEEGGGDEADGS